ncbi:brassinosteroid-responsive RING protein 1-like [Macadamia integrifolia]|uniref:brassinosteroid-responsive RING protein 1-like n=1 Tax=Macadamia integrifolia TaxID=60698 RepID=UPI001C531001|nr:brassinosteroid-responsive RING protein 1-like [Macadamia integrifolia]
MGFPCVGRIEAPKLLKSLINLLTHIRIILMFAIFHLRILDLPDQLYSWEDHIDHALAEDHLPASSQFSGTKNKSRSILESIKRSLPVTEFGSFIERLSGSWEDDKSVCAVCLSCMERSHEIRELPNCSHMFHRECLDRWVDQGQVTCPLCRSKLLPTQVEQVRDGRNSWLVERIAYLFGEDLLMAMD